MKMYSGYGYNDFAICFDCKGDVIRDYFLNYGVHNRNLTMTPGSAEIEIHNNHGKRGLARDAHGGW